MRAHQEKKNNGERVENEKKSDRVGVHHKKERLGEFTIRKSEGVRVHHEKKKQWGENSPREQTMG